MGFQPNIFSKQITSPAKIEYAKSQIISYNNSGIPSFEIVYRL